MKNRKNIRLKNYDYRTDGYYFITAVCRQRDNLFENRKRIVEEELLDLERKTQGLKLDYFVVMPNHVHTILILENCPLHLGEIVRRFKAKVSHKIGKNVWQANYYEHIIRSETALQKIREYIVNNPAAELLKFEQFY